MILWMAVARSLSTLSDPRDLRDVRYVGQTRSPGSRYCQHVNKASPWLPDEMPWWVKAPKDRPLHDWVRQLYRDGARLPFMIIVAWCSRHINRTDCRTGADCKVSGRGTADTQCRSRDCAQGEGPDAILRRAP